MKFDSIDDLAAGDLSKRHLKLGDYGLTALSPNDIAGLLGYHTFTKAPYGIGIPYPSGKIGNIRLGQGHVGSKYMCIGGVTKDEVYWLGNKDADQVLVLEGEFKAITAHLAMQAEGLDLLIIGLTGVDNWVGTTSRRPLHGHFERLVRGKRVTVCFDYDGTDIETPPFTGQPKEQVRLAESKLLASLQAIGCAPGYCRIGTLNRDGDPRDKYAIDDWLLAGGALSSVLARVTSYDIHRVPDEKEPGTKRPCSFAAAEAYALASYGMYAGDIVRLSDGQQLPKAKALDQWTGFLCREVDDKMVNPLSGLAKKLRMARIETWGYWPGQDFGLIDNGCFNLWKRWGPSCDGDVTPWTDLVEFVLGDQPEARDFFHQWVGYLIQNPGGKNFTYIAFTSPQGGVGKSLLAESIMYIMGPAASELASERLFTKNNELLAGKSLIVINELSSDKAKHVNELKAFVTSSTLQLEEKYKATRTVPNIANFIVTSNSLAPVLTDHDNRRDTIIKVRHMTMDERIDLRKRAERFVEWLEADGAGIMRSYYVGLDLGNYSPRAAAPRFEGFELAVQASMSNAQYDCQAVEEFVKGCGLDSVVLTHELVVALCGGDQHTARQVGRLLLRSPLLIKSWVQVKQGGRNVRANVFKSWPESSNAEQLRLSEEAVNAWLGGAIN